MANTSANTRPPVTANALKAQAFYSLNWDLRDGEWVPALYFPSSAGALLVNLMSKIHVLVKFSHKPLILDSPSSFHDSSNAINRIFAALRESFRVKKERINGLFPKDWFKFTLIFFVYPINICRSLLTSACTAQIILYTIFQ